METKESVSTELDPNVPVEDVVTALNDSTVGPEVLKETAAEKYVKLRCFSLFNYITSTSVL